MKLTYKKGKGDKIHISIDDEYALTVDETFFYSLSLKQGQDINCEELNKLTDLIGERRAYNLAISLLSRRDHTAKELTVKLGQKGFEQFAEKTIQKLTEQGFINDERFARCYINELINLKGYGKRRIEQELYRKGVNREIIREVIDEAEFDENKLTEIINRKYLRYLDSEKGRQKTVNALMRLGYSYSETRDAIKTVCENNDEIFLEVTDE